MIKLEKDEPDINYFFFSFLLFLDLRSVDFHICGVFFFRYRWEFSNPHSQPWYIMILWTLETLQISSHTVDRCTTELWGPPPIAIPQSRNSMVTHLLCDWLFFIQVSLIETDPSIKKLVILDPPWSAQSSFWSMCIQNITL